MGTVIRDDPEFISTAMRFLYADRLFCLKSKSVTGRSKTDGDKKETISLDKRIIFQKLFDERMNLLDDGEEKIKRTKKLNEHIKDALAHISKSEEIKTTEKEVSRN